MTKVPPMARETAERVIPDVAAKKIIPSTPLAPNPHSQSNLADPDNCFNDLTQIKMVEMAESAPDESSEPAQLSIDGLQ